MLTDKTTIKFIVVVLSVNIDIEEGHRVTDIIGCVIAILIKMLTKTSMNFHLVMYTYVNPWNSSTLYIYTYI